VHAATANAATTSASRLVAAVMVEINPFGDGSNSVGE
jgi:hypothetical protein